MPFFRIRTRRTLTGAVALAVLLIVSGTVLTRSITIQLHTGLWLPAGNGLNLSSPRSGAAAVQLADGSILVTGGNDGSSAIATVDIFDTTGNYSSAAPMEVARSGHTATLLADGTVLVTGGIGSDGNATNSAEIYNPSTNTWKATGSLLTARSGQTATALPDGTVLLAGGDGSGTPLASLEIYSPHTGTFSAVSGSLSSPREKHAAAALPNGDVLIAGGWNGSAALATTDIYSFSAGTIAAGPRMSTARQGLSATAQLDGDVLLAGGNDGAQDLASAEVYNAAAGTFAATGSMTTARQGHQAFLLPHSGAILIVGGTTTVGGTETATASAELYYPLASGTDANPLWNGTFTDTGVMASPRVGAAGSPMSNGTPSSVNDGILFVTGGKDASGSALSTGELYGFAWVKTDATDYAPGTTVNITGGGWQPGETVTLHLQESPYFDSHPDMTVVADSNGNISNSQFAPDSHDVDIRFYLTATGSNSSFLAQTTFTDSVQFTGLSVSTQTPSPVTSGNPAGYAVSATFTGSNSNCQVTLSTIKDTGQTGLPAQASPSFSLNPVSATTGGSENSTLSIGTSGVAPGTYTFSVQGVPNSGCGGSSKTVVVAASLVVSGSAPQIISLSSTTFTAGSAGSFTVTTTGSPAPSLSESGALPNGVTFISNLDGTASLSGTATAAGTYNIVIAAKNGISPNATQNFTLTVNAGPLASMTLSPATASVTAGGSQSYTATGYDQYHNLIGDVTASTVFTVSNGTCTGNSCSSTVAAPQTVTGKDGSVTGSAALTVTAGATTQLALSPATAAISAGSSQAYTAQGLDMYGNPTGDLTTSTTFTITGSGSCAGASCTSNVAGPYTVTGTYINGTKGTAALTVNPGSFTQLQILLPGQTAAPGTTSGYIGSPSIQYVNGAFNVTVNAVDQYFNLVNTITDTAAISSNDAKAILPTNAALVAGTGTLSVTPETVSYNPATTTFTTSDSTNNSINQGVSQPVEVIVAYTAAITPTQAANAVATSYALTISNAAAPNTNSLQSATVAIPVNGGVPSNISVAASNGSPVNWLVDSNSPQGFIRVRACVNGDACYVPSANNGVGPGGTITVSFTATANEQVSSAPVQEVWNTVAFAGSQWANPLPLAPPEPTVGIGVGPTFTSAANTAFTYGAAGTFTVATNGVPANTLSESGSLPPGVTFTDNGNNTATIAGTPSKAGTYAFTITAHNGYGSDATQSFTLTVNKANAIINVTPYKVTYDANPHTATGTATGVGNVDLSADLNLNGTTHTNAGTYSDNWSFTDPNGNYNSATGTVSDEIDQAKASISVTPYHTTYDGNPNQAVGAATGVGGVNLSADLNLTNTIHTNAGTYSADFWTFTDSTGNYTNVGPTTITDQIDRASAVITVQGYSVVYDTTPHTATGTATGVKGEPLAGLDLAATTHTNAGNYTDGWTFTDVTGNYNNATGTVADVIAKATPVFSKLTPSQTIPYGEATVGISGMLAAPTATPPDGDLVTISINGTPVSQTASLTGGTFNGSLNSSTISAAAAPYAITYSFAGDANFNPAADTSTSLTVQRANTVTAIALSSTSSTLGDTVTLTATVADASAGSSGAPTGPVTFFDGSMPIGIGILNGGASDQAVFTTALLASGTHQLSAIYDSDSNFNPSGSTDTGETVALRGSSVAVMLNPATVVVGQSSKVTVTVTDTGSNPPGGADAFASTGAPATGTTGATLTPFADGLALVAGGLSSGGTAVQNAYLYNAATGTFTPTGSLKTARAGATATLLPNGKILIAGGSSDGTAAGALNSAELYDSATGTFITAGAGSGNAMVAARVGDTATLLANGQVLLAGGENSGGALNSAELYNPTTDSFTATGSLGDARYGAASARLANGQVLVAGGTGASSTVLSSSELYDPASGKFVATGGLGTARTGATATLLLNQNVLVAGGSSDGSTALNSAELFDAASGTFAASNSNLNTARLNGTANLLPSGMVLLAGGAEGTNAELYDSESDRFASTGNLVHADQGVSATLLNNGDVLLVGLTSGGTPAADAELYAPSFHPLGTIGLSSSEATDTFGGSCVLSPGAAGTSACDPTVTPSNVATSPHTVAGSFTADAVHSASSNSAPLTVNRADTSTVVVSSVSPSTFGQLVMFTASVSVASPGSGNPTGTVQFQDNGSDIGAAVTLSAGSASVTTSTLQAGPHNVTALYSGDANFKSSSMTPPLSQTVEKATPVFSSLTASQSIAYGTKTISVSGKLAAPTATPPDGDTVTVSISGTPVSQTIALSGGAFTATLSTAGLSASSTPYVITYSFAGDANFKPASDSGTSLTVNPAATTTTVVSSLNPSTYGQTVTFTALVTNTAAGSPAVPTGSVNFTIDGGAPVAATIEVCPSALPANRLCARITTSALAVAGSPHVVSANYANTDGNFVSGTGTLSGGQSVSPAPLSITASSGVMTYGGTPFVVMPMYSGFVSGESYTNLAAQPICGPVFSTSTTAGPYASACVGAADSNYAISYVSGNVVVQQAASTTTVISSSTNNTSIYLQPVTFTATISPQFIGSPTGSVTFYDAASGETCAAPPAGNTAPFGTPVAIVSGAASITTTNLAGSATPHTILACYSGDTNFVLSSGTVSQTVIPAPVVFVSPALVNFTGQNVGTTSSPMSITLTNNGDADLAISSISIPTSTDSSEFAIKSTTCGSTLGYPGEANNPPTSCTISVTFTPKDTGEAFATVKIIDNNDDVTGAEQDVTLTGGGLSTITTSGSFFTNALFATSNTCGSITLGGEATIDSFDSTQGYGSSRQLSGGNVGTNGNVTLNGNATINGAVAAINSNTGSCKSSVTGLTTNGQAKATGGLTSLSGPVNYPLPPAPNPAPPTTAQSISRGCPAGMAGCTASSGNGVALSPGTYGNVQVSSGTNITLSTGTYNFNSLRLGGNSILTVGSGPVIINIAGAGLTASAPALDLTGGSIVNTSGIPSNLQFFYAGSRAVNFTGGAQAYATVYAPAAPVSMTGGSDFFGGIIGLTITNSGGTAIHYDRNLPNVAGGYLWLTAVIHNVTGLPRSGQVKLYLTNSTVQYTANGTSQIVQVPNAVVTLNSVSVTAPKTSYDLANNRWITSVPAADITGNTFVTGVAIPVPASGSASAIQNLSWSAAFSTDAPNITFQWQWSAGVYSSLGSCYAYQNANSAAPCYSTTSNSNALNVNPEDGAADLFGTDPAGTPENYKRSEIIGFFSAPAGVAAAAAEMSVAPSNYAFTAPQAQGTSSPVALVSVLTNNDGVTHAINGFSVTGANGTNFTLQSGSNSCTGLASLPAGASCNLYVIFTPTSTGAESARIVVSDDANNTPQSVYLTGSGQ